MEEKKQLTDYQNIIENLLDTIIPSNNNNTYKALVLSGGGVKGLAHLGALKYLEERDLIKKINYYSGTSVGGLIIILYVIGYSAEELFKVLKKIDFKKLQNSSPKNFVEKFGFDEGKKIETALQKCFIKKSIDINITLQELFLKTGKNIILTTTCVNKKIPYYLSHINFPDLPVLKAVKMSFALPMFFCPVTHNNNHFIDGGCMDNFPFSILLSKVNYKNILGIYIKDFKNETENIDSLQRFIFDTILCLMEDHARRSYRGFEDQTVLINCKNVTAMNLDLSQNDKEQLFELGYNECQKYLKTFSH